LREEKAREKRKTRGSKEDRRNIKRNNGENWVRKN